MYISFPEIAIFFEDQLNMFMLSKKKADKTITCNDSKFFNNDPKILEYLFPGILILSSFYSSSRGDAVICEYHDLFLLLGRICEQFKSKSVQIFIGYFPK